MFFRTSLKQFCARTRNGGTEEGTSLHILASALVTGPMQIERKTWRTISHSKLDARDEWMRFAVIQSEKWFFDFFFFRFFSPILLCLPQNDDLRQKPPVVQLIARNADNFTILFRMRRGYFACSDWVRRWGPLLRIFNKRFLRGSGGNLFCRRRCCVDVQLR